MRVRLESGSSLFLLPSPVQCFSQSRYCQRQEFELCDDGTSNLALLDWYTNGRPHMRTTRATNEVGESWSFDSYESFNTVRMWGQKEETIAHDALSLLGGSGSLRDRMAPYSVYATLFLFGPRFARVRARTKAAFESVTQYKMRDPYSFVWSYSEIGARSSSGTDGQKRGGGGIARCAGVDVESVKRWLDELVGQGPEGIESMIGKDLWQQALV